MGTGEFETATIFLCHIYWWQLLERWLKDSSDIIKSDTLIIYDDGTAFSYIFDSGYFIYKLTLTVGMDPQRLSEAIYVWSPI